MNCKNYIENCLRTESYDLEELKERLNNPELIRLLHSAMGLSTEANEFLDMLKKHIFYGKSLDLINVKEEIGDILWYMSISLDVLKTTYKEIMNLNIEKLKTRYPEKFTKERAINRNLDKEREIFEK